MEQCILTLDRYYLSVPALKTLDECEQKYGGKILSIVTKAKSNATAYEKPKPKTGRGRPPLKGTKVKLRELFKSGQFIETPVNIYGKKRTVNYCVNDLLWGQKLYRELRFVLVKYDDTECILVSSDLTLSPETIIEIYALRFKIETSFRELKQVIAGFAYHFWSLSMPKLKRFSKNAQMTESLESIQDERKKSAIVKAFKAIEGFTMFSIIAFGLIQMISLRFSKVINGSALRWLRVRSNEIPSEATTSDYLRKTFFQQFHVSKGIDITRLIEEVQFSPIDANIDPDG